MAKKKKKNKPEVNPVSAAIGTPLRRRDEFDFEDYPVPTRSPQYAKRIYRALGNDVVAAALEEISSSALSSSLGDELGFAVLLDENDPRPELIQPIRDFFSRCFSPSDYLRIVRTFLGQGDQFLWAEIDFQALRIARVLCLPTFQMFRIEDAWGEVVGFEQRLPGAAGEVISLSPLNTFQISYHRVGRYGRSLFHECLDHVDAYEDGADDLRQVSRSLGYQPTIHIMPPGRDHRYRDAYKQEHEEKRKRGPVSDYYLESGATVQKPFGSSLPGNADMVTHLDRRRAYIASRSRVPPYLLGVETRYAREIATQPALAYVRFLGNVRQILIEGFRHLIDLELTLLGFDPPYSYRIQFPKLLVSVSQDTDVDRPGVEDLQ